MRTTTCSASDRAHGVELLVDPAFDDALARIAQLTARLHAVADLHGPRRTVLGASVCRSCTRPFPCPTAQASGTSGGRDRVVRGTRRE